MRFELGDDRVEFADAVRKALADGCTPADVRRAWDHDQPLDRGIWKTLVEMGTTDPELDWVTRVAVAEEIGRAALPHPWVETAFVAGPIGAAVDDQLVSTDLGTPGVVPAGADVDMTVLRGADGSPYLVAPADVELVPVASVDGSRRLVEVSSWTGGMPLDGPVEPTLAGALGTAAVLVGLGQHLLDTTVAYVSEREQFGQPVGSFQAVKHHLANAAKDVAFARPMIWRAAHGLDVGTSDATRDVSTAKALASDSASLTADVALQCHGAIGYTVEYDLHLWLKRVWALSRAWGDAAHHRRLVGDALGLA